MSSRAALLVTLVGWLALAPMAAHAESVTDDLIAWSPSEGSWSQTESFDTAGSRGSCTEGRVTRWSNGDGESIGVVWARCPDAAAAHALLWLTWSSNGMFPAVGPTSAFGEGLELVSPYPAFDGLNRLWTQGEWFVSVARSCDPRDATGCDAASAGYARELAAIVGAPVDPVTPVERVPNDPFGSWAPGDDNGWMLSSASRAYDGDLDRCIDGAFTTWTGVDGGSIEAFWMRCASSRDAFRIQHERWVSLTDSAGMASVFGIGFDRVSRYGTDVQGVTRSWVQGDFYVNVQRTCPNGDLEVCDSATAAYAVELVDLIPGAVVEDTTIEQATAEAGWLFIVVPVLTFLLLTVPQRLYFWWRSRGYSVQTELTNFTAVDALVRRVRIGRIVRRGILTVLVAVVWFLTVIDAQAFGVIFQFLYVFLSPFVYFAIIGLALRLLWRPHSLLRLARRRGRPTPLGIAGSAIRLGAAALAGFTVVLYFLSSLMLIADRDYTPLTVQQQVAAGLTGDPFTVAWAAVRWAVHALDDTGTYFLVFLVMLAVPVTLAYLLDRFGQRLTRRSLTATLAVDDRPYFLYLRGFDEDRLRVDDSVGRRGFLELFTPFGRPRFEEVLVEYLTQFGPVIAIAGGKQVLSDLGAAKISLGNDEWRDKVIEWSAGARAVVMSATPREVRAGLEWEMEHVAASAEGVRIMLVLSPWSRDEVARRWAGFLERAHQWALFRPLAENPMPPGVTLMTYTASRGWHGYGAKRRWDWAYAASIVTAMENGDFDVPDLTSTTGTEPVSAATVEAS